jgi:catechol 2,3-dioxygenase-like lactoylglutathione lyase family enzyme
MAVSGVVPQIRTTNLDGSIQFYVSKLGFELAFKYEDFYAGIKVGDAFIHLKLVDDVDPSVAFVADGDHFHLYFTTDDVDAEARKLKWKGVVFRAEVADMPWGTREFYVVDDQGHVLCYAQSSDGA